MRKLRMVQALIGVALVATSGASAGTISLAWDPVSSSNLAGYRVYWGSAPGTYDHQLDVDRVSFAMIQGLADCTPYQVAVKARSDSGTLSASFSNEISGFPRPRVSGIDPATAERGLGLSVVISGSNFLGGATVRFSDPNIAVDGVTVHSCTRLTASVRVGSMASLAPSSVTVTNPDRSSGASAGSLFAVLPAIPPLVVLASPPDLSTGVPVETRPSVLFSEPLASSTVTPESVMVVDASGDAVDQAVGSPRLSGDLRTATVIPATPLAPGATYRLRVMGGPAGVRDLAGNPMLGTFGQLAGFTTARDPSGPTISSIDVDPRGTTARVRWVTDKAANGRVFYRKDVDTNIQVTATDPALETDHVAVLEGLAPSTTYRFRVQSVDGGGRTSASSQETFVTNWSPYSYLIVEAEDARLSPPTRAAAGNGSFRGGSIETPPDAHSGSPASPAGTARLGFYVPVAGTWRIWARIRSSASSGADWYESVDGSSVRSLSGSVSNAWVWTPGSAYPLEEGLHELVVGGGSPSARLDRIVVTNDPTFVATGRPGGDSVPPHAPSSLVAATSGDAVTLTWRNPPSDVSSIVIRFRTDGLDPSSPVDGRPALARPATASSSESFTMHGLLVGTAYRFAVFAVDPSENASTPARALVTPGAAGPQDGTLFSTSRDQYLAGLGTLRFDMVYGVSGSTVDRAFAPFLSPYLGLDGLHLEDPGHLLFSTDATAGLRYTGGFSVIRQNAVYRLDIETGAVSLYFDFDPLGVTTLDAFDVPGDGTIAFSTKEPCAVRDPDGNVSTLRPENVYVVEVETGILEMLLDGDALGLGNVDAIDHLPGGELVFSTEEDAVLVTGERVRQQNAYAWNPDSGGVRLEFDGEALGLYTLDALDLEVALPLAMSVPAP